MSLSRMLLLRRHMLSLAKEMDSLTSRIFRDDSVRGFLPIRSPFQDFPTFDLPSKYLWMEEDSKSNDESISSIGKKGFQVSLDVQKFRPDELTVKATDDSIVIEGKHEERHDESGSISRQFIRKYDLPKGFDGNKAISTLSPDGILTINIPHPPKTNKNEKLIEIKQTEDQQISSAGEEQISSEEKNKDQKQKIAANN